MLPLFCCWIISCLRNKEIWYRNYCELSANESKHDPLEAILVYLKYGQQKKSIYKEKCENDIPYIIITDIHLKLSSLIVVDRGETSNK